MNLDLTGGSADQAPRATGEHGDRELRVCVIGAGVSGLTAVKALRGAGIAVDAFECGSDVGGMWRYQNDSGTSSAYRSLHIDSSRQSLAWSDFAIPEDMPDYLSHAQVLEHFERYAERFDVKRHIRFRTRVEAVRPGGDGLWAVTVSPVDGGPSEERSYTHVIVANGHLWDPKYPDFPGEFAGEETHSHHYRTADPYEGSTVLVVGIGNSAVDIAVDLARRADGVLLSTRRSAWIMPKYVLGMPTDRFLRVLIRRLRLPVPVARGVLRHVVRITMGDQARFGVPRPEHPVWREHATLSQELLPYIGHGYIRVKPNVASLEGDEVAFVDGTHEAVDAIIYATGYRTSFPFLEPSLFEVKEAVPPPLYRRMVALDHPTLFFSGLLQPVGPTIPLVETQARWMAAVISGEVGLPDRAGMAAEVEEHRQRVARRYVNAARYTLEVDALEYTGEMLGDLRRARPSEGRAAQAAR